MIGCQASDVVMESAAFGYRDGQRVWAVSHKPDIAPDHLEVTGSPPAELAAIRETAERLVATEGRDDVDYTFDIPMDLAKALCGFRPDGDPLPPDAVSYVVEPLQQGATGVRQARIRERQEALTSHVEAHLFAAAEALGFERLALHPAFHTFFPTGSTNALVRLRGESSEAIRIIWGMDQGAPYIKTSFFVRKGAEPRGGTAGWAAVGGPRLTAWDRLLGRKEDPEEAAITVRKAKEALAEIDRHL